MLPVITANICGSNGVHKPGNILFDSGAQISLIRRETANSLRLHGQDITVNIVKVGGEEEEIQTKVYKVSVTGIDDKKKYVVRAIGIPCISDEIKGVRSSALAEQFSLPREKIRRGNGHIDLLVGIDHAHLHTGQTREVNHLVARKSPLGWVIFGSTSGDLRNVTTTVLHVKVTSPVDLSEFWTTEAMGVQVDPCICDANKLNQVDPEEKVVIEQSARNVGDQWMIPYPWKRNPAELPDNKEQAVKRLESTERRLLQKPNEADAYNRKIVEMEEMKQLNGVSFERCICPRNVVEPPILCVFADASRGAFGTCAYLRSEISSGEVKVKFIAAKSRVAPLKELTIPRLELQAAVLASRLCKSIEREIRIELQESILFTDSAIVLA